MNLTNFTAYCGLRGRIRLEVGDSAFSLYTARTRERIFGGAMKKIVILLIVSGTLLLCGCSAKPEGYDRVKRAKELFEELDGARVIMEDVSAGERLMEFSFYVNENDEMIFSYLGAGEGGEERCYSNGAEFYYKTADSSDWEVIGPADENYYYNIYTRDYRYPYARGSIFFLDGTSVKDARVTEEGGKTVTVYTYDPEKLNSYAVNLLDNVSSFSELTASYVIDENGYITEFTERGTVTDANGEKSAVDLRITVDRMNEIYEIEAPVVKTENAENGDKL